MMTQDMVMVMPVVHRWLWVNEGSRTYDYCDYGW